VEDIGEIYTAWDYSANSTGWTSTGSCQNSHSWTRLQLRKFIHNVSNVQSVLQWRTQTAMN